MAFFFVVWGLLDEEAVRVPWQTAGVGAGILLIGAVAFRELILRRLRQSYLKQPTARKSSAETQKLTIERASAVLKEIRRKSDAANVLDTIALGHREVFELCDAFVRRIEAELPSVQPGSPRLAALLKGRTNATRLHRHHMLRWAETEALSLSKDARSLSEPSDRERSVHDAVTVVDHALLSYPGESSLVQSRALLWELAISIKVTNLVEQAEKESFRGDSDAARASYRDAMFYLGRDSIQTPARDHAALRIQEAMQRLPISRENE